MGFRTIFSWKKCNEWIAEGFIQDSYLRHAVRLTAGFFPLSRRCRSFHLVSVFYKGKKDITSDALFADLLLSPSSRYA